MPSENTQEKIALTVQYLGDSYAGYQRQKGLPNIQEEIEKGLYTILREKTPIHAAGRTDTGVHALGQVIHFKLSQKSNNQFKSLENLIYSLNSVLPKDISVIYGSHVSHDFHARFSCISREYVYCVANHPFRPAAHPYFYWVRQPLDIKAIKETIPCLLGEKDFAAFTRANHQSTRGSTVRRIDQIKIVQQGLLFFFIIAAQAFFTICSASLRAPCWKWRTAV